MSKYEISNDKVRDSAGDISCDLAEVGVTQNARTKTGEASKEGSGDATK